MVSVAPVGTLIPARYPPDGAFTLFTPSIVRFTSYAPAMLTMPCCVSMLKELNTTLEKTIEQELPMMRYLLVSAPDNS